MELKELEAKACDAIDMAAHKLIDLGMYVYANPELSEHEEKAAAATGAFLKQFGFDITAPLPELPNFPTALKATAGSGAVKMAFLGEYDALPGLGHGCGHNLINMMSVGAAIGFHSATEGRIETTYWGCPAEETVGGKVYMSEAGLFTGYDGALIIHPGGTTEIGGTSLATHPMEITFHGKSAHVASVTNHGINALDGAVAFYQRLKDMSGSFTEYALLGAIITEGGQAPNVIPDKAVLRLTIRALTVEYLESTVIPAVESAALSVAEETGTTVSMQFYEPLFKELRQNERLNAILSDVMQEMGEEPVLLPPNYADGSTDVGNVSYDIPTAHPTLSIGAGLDLHTPEFAAAAGSPEAMSQALKGAKIMAVTALRYVNGLVK